MSYSASNTIIDTSGHIAEVTQDGALAVTSVSGSTLPVSFGTSGNVITPSTGLVVNAGTVCTGNSGGTNLAAGAVTEVLVQAFSTNTGHIFVGGTGAQSPFSGKGTQLVAGAGATFRVNNINLISCFATVSGDKVSSIGEV